MAALGTRSLTATIATVASEGQVTNLRLDVADADSDFTTFADAASGGSKTWSLAGTVAQDLAATSLWYKMWSAAGTTIAFLLKWYGNSAASTSQPHSSGNAVVGFPDGTVIGGDANKSATARWSVDFSWECTAIPTLVTT